jgi:hypothetical protein
MLPNVGEVGAVMKPRRGAAGAGITKYPAEPAGYSGQCRIFWSRLPPKNVDRSYAYTLTPVFLYRHKAAMKPGTPSFTSTRLLDQLRERIRYLHYSLQTEKAYLYWVRFFVRWHGRGGVMRHPRDMRSAEVEAFLNMLANERQVSPSTHNQALSAILFLYREVLAVDLPWLNGSSFRNSMI